MARIKLEDLILILENGFDDIDPSDPFQIAAKVNLDFLMCLCCSEIIFLPDIKKSGNDDYVERAQLIRELGWGFINPFLDDTVETLPICPICLANYSAVS